MLCGGQGPCLPPCTGCLPGRLTAQYHVALGLAVVPLVPILVVVAALLGVDQPQGVGCGIARSSRGRSATRALRDPTWREDAVARQPLLHLQLPGATYARGGRAA